MIKKEMSNMTEKQIEELKTVFFRATEGNARCTLCTTKYASLFFDTEIVINKENLIKKEVSSLSEGRIQELKNLFLLCIQLPNGTRERRVIEEYAALFFNTAISI